MNDKRMMDKRPIGECYDCGRKYGGQGWVDAVVADEVWEQIKPEVVADVEAAGLLCFCCMAKRCEARGLSKVEVALMSGPFVLSASKPKGEV